LLNATKSGFRILGGDGLGFFKQLLEYNQNHKNTPLALWKKKKIFFKKPFYFLSWFEANSFWLFQLVTVQSVANPQ